MTQLRTGRRLQFAILSTVSLLALSVSAIGTRHQEESGALHLQPNRSIPNGRYAGSDACAQCHADKVKSQKSTPMGMALRFAKDSEVLHKHSHLTFTEGPFTYNIDSTGNRTTFRVTDGNTTISEPVKWAFGLGVAGQTYVFTHDGRYIEGRVSYYSENKGLDVTVGHAPGVPRSIEDALGRSVGMDEARACFGCHTTRAVTTSDFDADRAVPGVTCESCHGPGADHITAMKAGNINDKHIFNPGTLGTEDLSNFCGACHRTWDQVALMGLKGVGNVRFQPYRLTNSKCYDTEDRRISCTACHDPHEDIRRDPSFYDSKCTECHQQKQQSVPAAARTPKVCPVAKEKCTTCHMPKYDLPGGHYTFTDHDIRIVRPGDLYPN